MQFNIDTSYRSRYQLNKKQAKNKRLMHLSNNRKVNMNVINQHLEKENIVFTNNAKTNSI